MSHPQVPTELGFDELRGPAVEARSALSDVDEFEATSYEY